MLVARLAGNQQANNATSVRMAGTSTNIRASPGPEVNNMLFTALDATIAMVASRAVKSMLFTSGPGDALIFVLVPAILTLVALLACWFPARRATSIEPSAALRDQ